MLIPVSRKHIPLPLQDLMINESSPIIDFYPTTFDIDMNGKKMAWQGVALLPFIDEKKLLAAIEPLYSQLTEEEVKRNSCGNNLLFVSDSHPLSESIASLYTRSGGSEVSPSNYIIRKNLAK
jgi:5'-3' exoribonuclease 2